MALARGENASLPFRLQVHMVAARYGRSPADVRRWPASDFLDALTMLPATSVVTTLVHSDG
ncbi:MAG TPA: hypothetical protein VGQ02_10845 [Candidatus Limnocylindrales bacterium]|jgi:hypothetical protein|nr:hypothetical protein [Candidatus Limnocylindrales bacterium]